MTKERYMALADIQTLWTDSMKPAIIMKVPNATADNLASLNANGEVRDSGYSAADLYEGTLYAVNISAITPATQYRKNSLMGINGVLYKAKRATYNTPVPLMIDNGKYVVDEIDGNIAFVVVSDTLSSDWEVFCDARVPYSIKELEQTFKATMEQHEEDVTAELATKPSIIQIMNYEVEDGYTIGQLLRAVANNLMNTTIVVNE